MDCGASAKRVGAPRLSPRHCYAALFKQIDLIRLDKLAAVPFSEVQTGAQAAVLQEQLGSSLSPARTRTERLRRLALEEGEAKSPGTAGESAEPCDIPRVH